MKDLTYNDYLSAVYSYEDAEKAASAAANRLKKIKSGYDAAIRETNELEKKISEIDKQIDKMVSDKIVSIKAIWLKSQKRFDVKLEPQKAMAEQKAQSDIANFEKKLNDDYSNAVVQEKKLRRELTELNSKYAELQRICSSTSDLTVTADPPDNKDAYDLLVYSHDKKLLTEYQSQMLDQDVNAVCDTWVHSREELLEYQHDFAASDFYKRLKEGELTSRILNEISATVAVVSAAIIFIVSLLMCAPIISSAEPSSDLLFKFACGYNIILSAIGATEIGVITQQLIGRYNDRHKKDNDRIYILKLADNLSLFVYRLIFGILGFVFGCAVFSALTPVRIIVSAAVCVLTGFFIKRMGRTDTAGKFFSGFVVFRDRARADLFAEYEMLEKGKYNFMIYCYLKYDAIYTYLSMKESQKKTINAQKNMTINRERYKRATEEHKNAQATVRSKQDLKKQAEIFKIERKAKLKQELYELESKRPPKPDFEKEAREALKPSLFDLNSERDECAKKLIDARNTMLAAEKAFNEIKAQSSSEILQLERINNALRLWKQTPLPEVTGFRLVDSICLETPDKITILHHDSKPYVIRYNSIADPDDAENLSMLIFHYVHGLCKINPRRLLQINIFDYISDPKEYLNNRSFRRLKADGFLEAVQTTNQFELRLFGSPERSRTFMDVFQSHSRRISAVAEKYADSRSKNDSIDIAFANKWTTKRNRLTYQVCIFVVPRGSDKQFSPPSGIIELIKSGDYKQKGILPVFFADNNSISPKWTSLIERFNSCPSIFTIQRA